MASLHFILCIAYIHCIHSIELYSDPMSSTASASNWDSFGDAIIPITSSRCVPLSRCFALSEGGWVERTFSTKGSQDIEIRFYLDGDSIGALMISIYDSNNLISPISQ